MQREALWPDSPQRDKKMQPIHSAEDHGLQPKDEVAERETHSAAPPELGEQHDPAQTHEAMETAPRGLPTPLREPHTDPGTEAPLLPPQHNTSKAQWVQWQGEGG